jgi:hypothetical protein
VASDSSVATNELERQLRALGADHCYLQLLLTAPGIA